MPTTLHPRLGTYVMPGRAADSARAPREAAEIEALGLGTAWISDRSEMKEAAVLGGAMAACTSQTRIGVAVTHVGTRHPKVLAGIGATMQELSQGRFRMGFGRSTPGAYTELGLTPPSLDAMRDNAEILRRLWAGQHVDYRGPLGDFTGLRLHPRHEGDPPELLLAAGGPRMLALGAAHYDGVLLETAIGPETAAGFAAQARQAAGAAGRDPERLRVIGVVVVAADLSAEQQAAILGGRLVTYLQMPGFGDRIAQINGWDPSVVQAVRDHPLFGGRGHEHGYADASFSLESLAQIAVDAIPEAYVREVNATGTVRDVAARLHEYLDNGVDELILHGSSPDQLEPVIDQLSRTGAIT